MKNLFLSVLVLVSTAAMAQGDDRGRANLNNVNVNAGFNAGGFTFGAGYERMLDGSTGFGGHFRMFSKDKKHSAPGIIAVGADLGHHFYKKAWDLAFTPSFNLLSISSPNKAALDDATTFGPGLSISLTWALTEAAALGFDFQNYWVWFDEDWRAVGPISDLSVKFRYGF